MGVTIHDDGLLTWHGMLHAMIGMGVGGTFIVWREQDGWALFSPKGRVGKFLTFDEATLEAEKLNKQAEDNK